MEVLKNIKNILNIAQTKEEACDELLKISGETKFGIVNGNEGYEYHFKYKDTRIVTTDWEQFKFAVIKAIDDKLPTNEVESEEAYNTRIKKNKSDVIKELKNIRVEMAKLRQRIVDASHKYGFKSSEVAFIRLQESRMWLGMGLQELDQNTPYIHADNPENEIVSPEADIPDNE